MQNCHCVAISPESRTCSYFPRVTVRIRPTDKLITSVRSHRHKCSCAWTAMYRHAPIRVNLTLMLQVSAWLHLYLYLIRLDPWWAYVRGSTIPGIIDEWLLVNCSVDQS